ncbi:hypothetical protein S40285_07697 [Stachybotrys chlorohalonatus IBT 40285]|uniref:DWNN domain-containing protein n=1 Tax=Stachybotrys chlorohalonatus (strain IBT 40285) TaxID=1283841 RepID=A0A084Q8L1_STAC4|nr:hypothetical protein S40285_07697 [Stachybotrys chlorohalonata IBT 40285]
MASSVFFKFKSQKEPTRVEFDGTGISVFELKREIILRSGLGDGSDFDLFIYTNDNSEEYDDDTTILPRSTVVIARRQPALKPGAGRAARYVSGKMPVSAKNAGRREQASKAAAAKANSTAISQMHSAMTEEEKMAAMFAAQSEQWSAQQEEMSHQTPVFKAGGIKRPANVPDHEPPNGYICFRCGDKGHWIQMCPTNDNPEYDNRPRVKRTTGIPRAFLQKVDKATILAQSDGDETKRPSGIMVNAEGEFVRAAPDKASWEQFQARANTSAVAKEATVESKEVKERGLECSLDNKMFIDPMKTPCCQKTFCNDCITNALIESDFVCPACKTEGVLIDDLQQDDDMSKRIQEYLKEKDTAKATPPASPTAASRGKGNADKTEATGADATDKAEDAANQETKNSMVPTDKTKSNTPPSTANRSPSTEAKSPTADAKSAEVKASDAPKADGISTKKRPADELLENPKIPKGPKAMQNQQQQNGMPNMMNGMPDMGMNGMMFNGMGMMPNMMGMPNMGMNMNMGMPGMMGMPMMGMPNFPMNGGFGGMSGWDMNSIGGMSGMNGMNGMNGNGMNNNMGHGMNGAGMQGMGGGMPGFYNGGNFSQTTNEEDAYFRKPVNPHRHQNKQRRARPSDYREL